MKKRFSIYVKISLLLIFALFLFGCKSVPKTDVAVSVDHFTKIPIDKVPGPGESVVTIQREDTFSGSLISMKIWIDDKVVANGIRSGDRTHIVVPKGSHTIQAGSTGIDKGKRILFKVNDDDEVVFLASPIMGIFTSRFRLIETGRRNLRQ